MNLTQDSNNVMDKVTVFMTRGTGATRELLVFRHPSSGVHLPAGTVEENEAADVAALRETWEETGLDQIVIAATLGAQTETMRADYRMVLRRVTLRHDPAPDAAPVLASFPTFLGLRRGLPVRQIGDIKHGYAPAAYEEFDGIADATDAVPSRTVSGWVPAGALTPTIRRHFFHLTPTIPTPDAWTQTAEEWEHRFELYWVTLPTPARAADAGLIPSQARWLAAFADRLTH